MLKEEMKQLIRVAKKYYLLDMKQDQIARSENISKSTVSRLINKSKKLGYVKFYLDFPAISVEELEEELKETFQLKHIFVAESENKDPNLNLSNVTDGFARYMNSIISDGDIIGISWGSTMRYVSENLIPLQTQGVKIVQINGSVSRGNIPTEEIIRNFAKNYDAASYYLNVPIFVDNKEIANVLKKDSRVKEVLQLVVDAKTVIFGVGNLSRDSVLIKAGYFTEEDYKEMQDKGYVGSVCSRFIKDDGTHDNDTLYHRAIGIPLEEVRRKENSICVAVGKEKAEVILAALKAGYINTLFTDEITAQEVVHLYKEEQ